MSYDLLIHEYLDTGLDETRQEALFSEIAKNPELRSEFNNQIKLQNIAKSDLNSISTPPELTSNIFGELGFSVPSVAEKTGFWTRLNTIIIAALLGLGLGGGLFYGLSSMDSAGSDTRTYADGFQDGLDKGLNGSKKSTGLLSNSENSSKEMQNSTAKIFASGLNNASKNKETTNNNGDNYRESQLNLNNGLNTRVKSNMASSKIVEDESTKSLNDSKRYKSKNHSVNALNSRNDRDNLLTNSGRNSKNTIQSKLSKIEVFNSQNSLFTRGVISNSKLESAEIISNEVTIQNRLSAANFNSFSNSPNTSGSGQYLSNNSNYSSSNPFDISPDDTKWAVGIRQINQINVEPAVNSENSLFLNRSLFVNYKLSPSISLVGEFGTEKFLQEYEQIIAGTDVQTTQNPILTWYGVGAKFRANGFLDQNFIVPYIQTVFAANSIGPVLRPTLGVDFRMSELFTITTSYDRPILFYSVFGENLRSSKNGFTFGLNVNF